MAFTGMEVLYAFQGHGKHVCVQEVQRDSLLSDVLSFPAGTDLHDHPLVKEGCVILQVNPRSTPAIPAPFAL